MINKESCTGFTALVLAAGMWIAPAHADTRITLSGTAPTNANVLHSLLTGSMTPAKWYAYNTQIGKNWLPGTPAVRVDYPATLGHLNSDTSLDASVATGQASLDKVVKTEAALGHTTMVGLSQGAVVIDAELARLATDPAAPPPASVSVVLFGDPTRGLFATYFPPGLFLGLPGLTVTRPVDSQYNIDVVKGQYDG